MMTRRIYVREEHIRMGQRWQPHTCPIALALSEVYLNARVHGDEFYTRTTSDSRYTGPFPLPTKVRALIWAFDRGETVRPFSFDLTFP